MLGFKVNKNIIPIKNPLWKDLVFYFVWINNTSDDFLSYGLKYDAGSGKLIASENVTDEGDKIAYDLGLFDKPNDRSSKNPVLDGSHVKKHYSVSDMLKLSEDIIVSVAKSLSLTKKNNPKNIENSSSNNKTDDSANVSASNDKKIEHKNDNPFNILHTIAAMLMITVFFGVDYSKR